MYDRFGEESINSDGGGRDPTDLFDTIFRNRPGDNKKQRKKTKDVIHPLKVSLEQLYQGATKKMAVKRQVIDKQEGVQNCSECQGRGLKVKVVQVGPMIQQMQSECHACSGEGKLFKRRSERQILEVHIPKGSADNHKQVFREMADEHPDADTGDVVFMLKEQEHSEFKRKGADLFIERKISLVEALCGFEIEVTHLDGRKLLIKSEPNDIVRPAGKFDPLSAGDEHAMQWECLEGFDCPSLDNVAEADTTDVDTLKKAVETQLKRKGINVGAFVVDGERKRAYFKSAEREEVLHAKKSSKNCSLYVVADPNANCSQRLMKAVKGEGMPTLKNPFVHGNLFLILTIEFPDALTPDNQEAIRKMLPPPLNETTWSKDDEDVEVHGVVEIDPIQSFNDNKANMSSGQEAYNEDEAAGDGGMRGPGGQHAQCAQM